MKNKGKEVETKKNLKEKREEENVENAKVKKAAMLFPSACSSDKQYSFRLYFIL
jgi:hypothetical protein